MHSAINKNIMQAESNILASPEVVRGDCLRYVLASAAFPQVRRINMEIKYK